MTRNSLWTVNGMVLLGLMVALTGFVPLHAGPVGEPIVFTGYLPGSGDGRIHILPAMSSVSLKNGDKATIQAVVKAMTGVASVMATIEREDGETDVTSANATQSTTSISSLPVSFLLEPAPMNLSEVNIAATVGLYQAEWIAHGLEETYYRVAITVTDREGHVYTDRLLRFSDPIAGNNSIGSLTYTDGGLKRMDSEQFPDERYFSCAVIDSDKGYAYFGTWTVPGRVVKVSLGVGPVVPRGVGAVTLNAGENFLRNAVIDADNGYAYFGTWTSNGRVVKVALGEGANPPTRVGAVTLSIGENELQAAVIDPANGYAYFGTGEPFVPGRVVKVALGAGANLPTRVGAVTLEDGENQLASAVIDVVGGYAYFGTGVSGVPGRVVKVALGAGANLPMRVGAVTLEDGESQLNSAVIDVPNGYSYFGTFTEPGRIVKVALGAGANPPTRVGAVTLEDGESQLASAVIDVVNGYAHFGTVVWGTASPVVKVALGSGANPPTRVGAVTLEDGENQLAAAVIDTENGYAYFGTNSPTCRVVRVALSHKGFVKGTRFNLPEKGLVESVSFLSHTSMGNLRLALYNAATSPALLWESGAVANIVKGDWVTVSIANGTPSSLLLPASDYWLAWQVDTMADVPCYTLGNTGEGMLVPYAWNAFPVNLESGTPTAPMLTTDRWSAYITYSAKASVQNWGQYE